MTNPEVKPVASVAQTMSNKLAVIRAFEAAGFAMIPLKGKVPAIKNWVETPVGKYTPEQLSVGNYGVVLGAEDLVLDIDPRNFKPGDKPVSRLMAYLGVPLKSFTVKTGGDGLHIYFKKPAGLAVRGKLKDYPGIDIRTLGGQVVGPGCVHPDTGKMYSIALGTSDIREAAPEKLLELVRAPENENFEANAGTRTYQIDKGTQERFASYLKDTAPTSGSFKVAAYGRDLGLPPETTWKMMVDLWSPRRASPKTPDELKTRVINAYKYAANALGNSHPAADFTPLPMPPKPPLREEDIKWDMTAQGNVRKSFVNLLNYMKSPSSGLAGVFGFNEFTARIEFANPAPWHKGVMPRHRSVGDNDLKMLKGYLAVNCKFEMPIGTVEEGLVVSANANKFHPIREYLSSLSWDKKPRLDTWLIDFCGARDDEYTRAVARKVLCAAVMRVFKPGCKFDHAVVLEGEQGIGKSAICAILGGEWSGDFTVDPHNKDTIQLMQGKWIIELAELEITRRSDSDALKAFISRQVDTARLAYGRLANEFPRQSIFIATKNPGATGEYLKDDTGNRRWWPVFLHQNPGGMIDFKGLKAARNQLFAEAVALVTRPPVLDAAGNVITPGGERLDMETTALKDVARAVVKARHADHAWTERVALWIDSLPPERDFLTAREVFLDAMGGVEKQLDTKSYTAIALVMRILGWKSSVKRNGIRLLRGYAKPESGALGDLV